MELRQLKYFVKVAETLNFSEAAKALFITQSTLSQQIKQLEQEMNAQLFQRDSHSVALTEAGEELFPCALQTIYTADACIERIHDLKQLLSGTLNIGVTFSFSPILTETIVTFIKRYPNVKLNICYKPMAELMDMLGRREVDFVLAFKPTERYKDIESHILFDNYLAAIVQKDHPLAKKEKVSLAELERYDIALPSKGLQARNAFELVLSKYFSQLKVRVELNEVNILLKLIKQSNWVTILSEASIHNEQGVKAIPLDVPENEMAGCVHMLKNTYRKHSAQEFIRLLSESNAIRERIHEWL
ncbi:LysR substrate-binding domain-containing protein [Massilibacteroides sp.]|uniref:LysR substrate-binding domain-containing protein n=1 Tax=Massilibacteroides sp. TaxID=2034766 RepID=UPI00261E14B2|nr:LysR substrate-binding domain-containing protein [Massilibacteroides sp.]MDD4514182.1 LysR substrate-binding domain-containing protein [Massilibacteroides sp.]